MYPFYDLNIFYSMWILSGWDDTGFNFLIGEDGNVYVGRGWTNQGAHTLGKNNIGYGVVIFGNFKVDRPNDKAMNAMYNLIQCGIAEVIVLLFT